MLDSDGDDKLSFDDLTGIGASPRSIFDAADIDNDDFLDRTQYEGSKGKLRQPGHADEHRRGRRAERRHASRASTLTATTSSPSAI